MKLWSCLCVPLQSLQRPFFFLIASGVVDVAASVLGAVKIDVVVVIGFVPSLKRGFLRIERSFLYFIRRIIHKKNYT